VKAFRVALRRYGRSREAAFSGQSGFGTDGRWHTRGRLLDYAAQSLSLAALERLVHYKRIDALLPHVRYEIEVPDALIATLGREPAGWNGADLLPAAQALGDQWYDGGRTPALRVPSAVTPGELNLIVNAHHAAWDWKWVVSGPVAYRFDPRLVELLGARR